MPPSQKKNWFRAATFIYECCYMIRIHLCSSETAAQTLKSIFSVSPLPTKESLWLNTGSMETKTTPYRPKISTHETKQKQIIPLQSRLLLCATCSQAACSWPSSLALSWCSCWSSFSIASFSSVGSKLKWASGGPGSRPFSGLAKICTLWSLKTIM